MFKYSNLTTGFYYTPDHSNHSLQMTLFQQQFDMQGHRLMHRIIQTQLNVFISGTSTVSRVLCCVEDFSLWCLVLTNISVVSVLCN